MTDREKVMMGLKCLTHVDDVVYKRECLERGCPFMNTDCEIAVMEDAYNLLMKLDVEPEELERLKLCRHECKVDCLLEAFNQVCEERDRLKTIAPDGVNKYGNVEIDPPQEGLNGAATIINWRSPEMGFGQFTMWWDDGHKLHMDTESMSDEFVQAVLAKLVGQMVREG